MAQKRSMRKRKFPTPSWNEFCENTTYHGVEDYHRSDGWWRIFWGITIFVAFSAAVYGCWAIVDQYLQSPVVISYMIHPSEENGRRLPDVVVCPFNRFNASYLARHRINDDLAEYIQTAFSLNTPYRFNFTRTVILQNDTSQHDQLLEMLERLGNLEFLKFIDRASFSCKSLISYCTIKSKLTIDCCENATSVITPVGKCYRIPGPDQLGSGFGYGMTLVISVPEDQYLSVGRSNFHNDGVSIKLAEQEKGLDFDLTFIPAGVHALMPLRATKYEFINDPPRYECLPKVNQSYSPITCFDNCFFEVGMTACNCSHVTSTNRNYPACTPHDLHSCLLNETMKAINAAGEDYTNNCHTLCKPACRYWQFYPVVSYAKFPSNTFLDYVAEGELDFGSADANWDKYIVLDVFYERLEYTFIKHYPAMTIDTFVSNIGGQVGLWVGGSVLSMTQLLIFILHYTCSKLINSTQTLVRKAAKKREGTRHAGSSGCNGLTPPIISDMVQEADPWELDGLQETPV